MTELKTTIGLEIHVQLKTKSKMFCRCDNNAENKAPNTVVCPVCLALPGALPVANKQAIEWTIKTGLALDCKIPKIAKFDRKHYFYPDLPKGYQISQYDEPFCVGGKLEIGGREVRLNRIHLEEDAGKLVHSGDKSLVDLNRAGTPLMEIVTEPDVTSPAMAGDFLRRLQKIVRDEVMVSEANMEKGHMRCDANISMTDGKKMSQIIELKNLNSFRFVEKALILVEAKLKDEYANWPEKLTKETWGYDSVNNKVYLQRRKEEAADYRYFPEPDLPPIDTTVFDLVALKSEIAETEEQKISNLVDILGISESDAKVLVQDKAKLRAYNEITAYTKNNDLLVKAINNNYFGFIPNNNELTRAEDFAKLIDLLADKKVNKNVFLEVALDIRGGKSLEISLNEQIASTAGGDDLEKIVDNILVQNNNELIRYKNGEKQLLGFFMGQIMKETKGKADPTIANKLLRAKLEE